MRRPLLAAALLACAGHAWAATTTTLAIGGGAIELSFDASSAAPAAAIEGWARRAAVAVSSFYGRFPVARVRVLVARVPGRGIHGTTYGGRFVRMRLGAEASAADLATDWTLTHELFHLAFPDLDERHHWMEEGMATYFEPIARARVGDLEPAVVWRDLFAGLPKGLPEDGDRGLDRTPTWGRTYWGGALFWFLADVDIRERTGNRRSADDALRAILAAGGDGSEHWPMERVLEVGDRATGTTVLGELYRRMATAPVAVDVGALAARLGVAGSGRFDDGAPLAAIRRSITAPTPP